MVVAQQVRRDLLELIAQGGVLFEGEVHEGTLLRGEGSEGASDEIGVGGGGGHGDQSESFRRCARSQASAAAARLLTVPTGMPTISAVSA